MVSQEGFTYLTTQCFILLCAFTQASAGMSANIIKQMEDFY
jgi:hypothetical protein